VSKISGDSSSDLVRDLIRRKDICVNFLAALGPLIEPVLGVAALFSPAKVGTAKGTPHVDGPKKSYFREQMHTLSSSDWLVASVADPDLGSGFR
jgi:hypothetical protein